MSSGSGFPDPAGGLEVEPAFLHGLIQAGAGGYILLDCREEDEHAFCQLPGDVLVPLSRFVPLAETILSGTEKPVIVYCHHGMRSAQAAHYLRSKGWANTFSLRGGIEAWSQEIDPAVPRY